MFSVRQDCHEYYESLFFTEPYVNPHRPEMESSLPPPLTDQAQSHLTSRQPCLLRLFRLYSGPSTPQSLGLAGIKDPGLCPGLKDTVVLSTAFLSSW